MIDILAWSCGGYAAILCGLWVLAEFGTISWGTATAPCRYAVPFVKTALTAATVLG